MMRFKVDENLPDEFAVILLDAGHDASTVRDQALGGHPDSEVAALCRSEQRALITLDLGFADIRAYPPEERAGIVVFRVRSQDRAHLIAVLRRALPLFETEPLVEHLWIVEEERVRIWRRW